MNGPSREEFTAFTERLYETMDGGFAKINARLDLLNGRTLKGELESENHRTRLVSLEKELFHRPSRRRDDEGQGAAWAKATVTKREGYYIGVGLAVLVAVLKVLEVVGTKLVHVLMSSKP